jgi:hypothetical protein
MKDQRALYIITTTMTPIAKPMTLSFYFFNGRGVSSERRRRCKLCGWRRADLRPDRPSVKAHEGAAAETKHLDAKDPTVSLMFTE